MHAGYGIMRRVSGKSYVVFFTVVSSLICFNAGKSSLGENDSGRPAPLSDSLQSRIHLFEDRQQLRDDLENQRFDVYAMHEVDNTEEGRVWMAQGVIQVGKHGYDR